MLSILRGIQYINGLFGVHWRTTRNTLRRCSVYGGGGGATMEYTVQNVLFLKNVASAKLEFGKFKNLTFHLSYGKLVTHSIKETAQQNNSLI